jgi:hypothetical protein
LINVIKQSSCTRWLASEDGRPVDVYVVWQIAFAGKPAHAEPSAVDFILRLEICRVQTERSDL